MNCVSQVECRPRTVRNRFLTAATGTLVLGLGVFAVFLPDTASAAAPAMPGRAATPRMLENGAPFSFAMPELTGVSA